MFKIGDKVRCVDNGVSRLLDRGEYVVVASMSGKVLVDGVTDWFFDWRFELVEETPALPEDRFIEQVLREMGYESFTVNDVRASPQFHPSVLYAANLLAKLDKYEPQPKPVDPDLLIAREAVASTCTTERFVNKYRAGDFDDSSGIIGALRALQLAREKGAL